jgi:coenzyme F420-reducing hydrogenase beta subunit
MTERPVQPDSLFSTVVDGGCCIGCGACACAPGGRDVSVELNEFGCYQARRSGEGTETPLVEGASNVCPFCDEAANEDEIASECFDPSLAHDPHAGYYRQCYAGAVAEGEFRRRGSSGGMTTWLLAALLEQNEIDAVLHVRACDPGADGVLFKYTVSRDREDVLAGSRSRYYPIEMSEVLAHVLDHGGRYALVGLPCFIKAARLLARQVPPLKQRIRYYVALFCGHLKSTAFADCLAWQVGIPPGNLEWIDFRTKLPDRKASDYGIEVVGVGAAGRVHIVRPVRGLLGSDWGLGLFKYHACDYCDDVVGETGDVSIGDAWLPGYVRDHRGTNLLVVRNETILRTIGRGMRNGSLELTPVPPETVRRSQSSGFRHRRSGLSYRLYLADKARLWRPVKRVAPRAALPTRQRERIVELRLEIAQASHHLWRRAVAAERYALFAETLERPLAEYRRLYAEGQGPRFLRPLRPIASGARRYFRQLLLRSRRIQ